jgi:hypothetical protein
MKKNPAKDNGTTRCNVERLDEGLRILPTDPTTLPRWEFYQCKLGKKKYFSKRGVSLKTENPTLQT